MSKFGALLSVKRAARGDIGQRQLFKARITTSTATITTNNAAIPSSPRHDIMGMARMHNTKKNQTSVCAALIPFNAIFGVIVTAPAYAALGCSASCRATVADNIAFSASSTPESATTIAASA